MKKKGIINRIKGWFRRKDEDSRPSEESQGFIPFNEELVPPEPPEFKTDPERVEAMFQAQAERHGVKLDPADRSAGDAAADPDAVWPADAESSDERDEDYASDDSM